MDDALISRRSALKLVSVALVAAGLLPAGAGVSAGAAIIGSSAASRPIPPSQADFDIMCRTVWGESRNQGLIGMRAVAAVILNRRRLPVFPNTLSAICLQKRQFSVWNKGDPNRAKMRKVTDADPSFLLARQACTEMLTGTIEDMTGQADHYHSGARPRWAKGRKPTARIGGHTFYRLF